MLIQIARKVDANHGRVKQAPSSPNPLTRNQATYISKVLQTQVCNLSIAFFCVVSWLVTSDYVSSTNALQVMLICIASETSKKFQCSFAVLFFANTHKPHTHPKMCECVFIVCVLFYRRIEMPFRPFGCGRLSGRRVICGCNNERNKLFNRNLWPLGATTRYCTQNYLIYVYRQLDCAPPFCCRDEKCQPPRVLCVGVVVWHFRDMDGTNFGRHNNRPTNDDEIMAVLQIPND